MFTRERLAYVAAYVALSAAFCAPLFAHPFAGGTGDWDQQTFYYASVLKTAAAGQLPFWDPWYCGGNVLWQNPQVSVISPIYLLALVMPLALAMKINVLAHYIAGCVGMHLVLRRIAGVRSPFVIFYGVVLFVCSGGIALHLRSGHVNFLPILLLPLLVYCFYRAAAGHGRSLLFGGAIVAIAVLNGGSHIVPLGLVLLGALGLGALIAARTVRPLVMAVAIGIAGCAYAAPKLIPVVLFTQSPDFQDRRPVKHPDFMSLEMVRRALADGSQGTELKVGDGAQKYAWHEYGNYLGWFGAPLFLIAAAWILAFRWRRDRWREVAAAIGLVVVLIMAAGEFAAWAPATLLRGLPGFSNFRIPSRYILLVPLAGSLCLGFAVQAWYDRRPRALARALVNTVCVFAAAQLIFVNRESFRDVFVMPAGATELRLSDRSTPVVAEREPPEAALSRFGENSNLMRSMALGVSPLNCYEQLVVRRIAHPAPAEIQGDGESVVSNPAFSPNRIGAQVTVAGASARVVLNQNFADGWSTSAGPVQRDPTSGRPSAVLPAGYSGPVAFTFIAPGFWMGLTMAALAVALSFVAWRYLSA